MTTSPQSLPDIEARKSALGATDCSLLIEAGAGSGKTSVMAGRVAILLAQGVEPKNIAAITFTEFAASELMMRIERFVSELNYDQVPRDLEAAFPNGVSHNQSQNIAQARKTIDQLTCTTIHGFAQALIKPYPVEANIDPGAQVIDPAEADIAFDEQYEAWLRIHLSGETDDDLIARIVLGDEGGGLELVRSVAVFLRHNRTSRPVDGGWRAGMVQTLSNAANAFQEALDLCEFSEQDTQARCEAWRELVTQLAERTLDLPHPSNQDLVAAITLALDETCFTRDGGKRLLRTKGKWETAAREVGKSKTDGSQAFAQASTHYEECHTAAELLRCAAASQILSRLAESMEGLARQWRDYKRSAALLDFDDLLYTARDLLAQHEPVRQALAKRFSHVLVDEFQDTDPLQIDILWRLCGQTPTEENAVPLSFPLRPGSLFLVGDPKQAIYRFRGADVKAYLAARAAIGDQALFRITANFRSVQPLIDHVNEWFAGPLCETNGQPGFTALSPIRSAASDTPAVMALEVPVNEPSPKADMRRDAEAEQVAEFCEQLVRSFLIQDERSHQLRPCRPGDIALLAPVGTDLWRFEEALENRSIAVSTQAGKGFFRRQEIQDLIALTRALADGRDTLALGSLLRGPLVGLTEAQLLDIAESLPLDPDHIHNLPCLNLWSDSAHIQNEPARSILPKLQALGKRASSTTPYMLLAEALDTLAVRSHLRQRFTTGSERALANIDLFLEMARAYDVRGLRAFAADMRANWDEATRQVEGRPDAQEESVSLITVHASKGLEWPIVIPINMTGDPRPDSGLMYDRNLNVFSIAVFGVEPTGHERLKTQNHEEQARERVRLWYVAATRARDLLVLPRHHPPLKDTSWCRIVDMGLDTLPTMNFGPNSKLKPTPTTPVQNAQTRTTFATEAARIAAAQREVIWQRPSRNESPSVDLSEPIRIFSTPEDAENTIEASHTQVAGSATRGVLLHKLMEEILNGETPDGSADIEHRFAELLKHLGITPATDPQSGLCPQELAATIGRTLTLSPIKELRSRLVPERSVYGSRVYDEKEILVSGIADAIAFDESGAVEVVIDWKSDVTVEPDTLEKYRCQLSEYCNQTGASRALLVLMTPGKIIEISHS